MWSIALTRLGCSPATAAVVVSVERVVGRPSSAVLEAPRSDQLRIPPSLGCSVKRTATSPSRIAPSVTVKADRRPRSGVPGKCDLVDRDARHCASRCAVCRAGISALEGRGAMVAERLVALAHGLAKAVLGGPSLEAVALGRVAGDAVEDRAEDLGGVKST